MKKIVGHTAPPDFIIKVSSSVLMNARVTSASVAI